MVDSDPNSAKNIANCTANAATVEEIPPPIPTPKMCYLKFAHRDNTGPIRSMYYTMDKPGYRGLILSGNVNSDDKFYAGGYCNSTPAGSMEEFVRNCSFDIGLRDNSDSSAAATGGTPSVSASHAMSNTSDAQLNLLGDVNGDDTFYFRFRCPSPGNELAQYFYDNCYVCMGYSDVFRPTPDSKVCAPVTHLLDFNKWSRFRFSGDVNSDDVMFMGFYCGGSGSPEVVHSIQ